jgi:hypothetical protein
MTVISNAVRNASPGIKDAMIFDIVGCTALRGIDVVNSVDAPDELKVVYATGGTLTSIREAFDQSKDELIVEDGSELQAQHQVLVTDFTHARVVNIADTPTLAGGEWTLPLGTAPGDLCAFADDYPGIDENNFTYAVRSTVVRAQVAHFYISDTDPPILMMDPDNLGERPPEPIADGVEDMQIAIGIDLDGDGTVEELGENGDDDEWFYNHPEDTPPADPITTRPYRALRITVVARSVGEVTTTTTPTSLRPEAEDREASTTPDVFKRRALSTTIEIRNLNGSPL